MQHIRSILHRVRHHLNTHPAYAHYAVYAALLYTATKAFGYWPWTWVGLDAYCDNLAWIIVTEAFWPTAFWFSMVLAVVALFRRPWWKRGIAAVVLAAQFHDWTFIGSLPDPVIDHVYQMPIFQNLIALVFLGPILVAVELSDANPFAIAFATALHGGVLYAILRRVLWHRLDRAFRVSWNRRTA